MTAKIKVLNKEIAVSTRNEDDCICLTDIAKYKNADRTDDLIRNWIRNRNTIEFLGVWEHLNNPGFNPVEFDGLRKMRGAEEAPAGSSEMGKGQPLVAQLPWGAQRASGKYQS